jgi:hypothetical protein
MFAALAFWMTARNRELASGFGPPSLTAITISFPIRVNALAMAAQRFIFLPFLNSKALPISNKNFIHLVTNLVSGVAKILLSMTLSKIKYSFNQQVHDWK